MPHQPGAGERKRMKRTLALVLAALAVAPTASAVRLPAAGPLVRDVVVRSAPSRAARSVAVLSQLRADFRPRIVLAVGMNGTWYRIRLAARPNGQTGWIPANAADLRPTSTRVVIDRGSRTIAVWRGNVRLLHASVAVGAPGMETPLGSFYVTARFWPSDPFYGPFALETSAYSRLSEWPGGGVVGIHGTSRPWLVGRAVSHGCVRVANATALQLERLVPLGTPISIVG
jgi:lipoprotein-anchoring transpeptidase ErfK/SrfK